MSFFYRISCGLKLIFPIVILVIFTELDVFAQQIVNLNSRNSDKNGAIVITSDSVICRNSPAGFGSVQEISGSKSDPATLESEHHSVWYKIVAKQTGDFTFQLMPHSASDDYDFMLFQATGRVNESPKVLRVNKSRMNPDIKSVTGLDFSSTEFFVGEGPGNAFSRYLTLKKDSVYYLLVDNVYEGGSGHTIVFDFGIDKSEKFGKSWKLSLNVKNKESGKPLDANVLLLKLNYPNDPIKVINSSGFHFFAPLDSGFYYRLEVTADSFLTQRAEFKVYASDTFKTLDISLQKIEIGKKFTLENIYFSGGTAVMLRKSMGSLKQLAQALQDNPGLKIEIQGHVNQPYNTAKSWKESEYQSLSEARAKAVYDYLIKRDIDPSRLSYKGFGYSQMLFPYASTPEEQEQNRRVEILVIAM